MLRPPDRQANLPFLVYLTSTDEEDKSSVDVFEQTTLKDERVAISAKFFTMVKDDGQMITRDHPFYKWIGGKKLPRVAVFTSDGQEVGTLEGRASPTKLFALMKKAFSKDFKNNLDRTIKDYTKLLTAVDKIDGLRKALKTKEESKLTSSQKKALEDDKAELDAEEKELAAQEEELLKLERKA